MTQEVMRSYPWICHGEVGVILTGGLGNQIFQLVAGLSLADQHRTRLAIVDKVLRPWPGRNGRAELFDLFDLNGVATRIAPEETASTLGFRAAHWRIASCNSDLNPIQRNLRRKLAELAEWAELLKGSRVGGLRRPLWSQRGGGYDPRVGRLTIDKLIVGYFQSYKYLEHTKRLAFLRTAIARKQSNHSQLCKHKPTARPYISLHVRRGDYKRNPQFGLLSQGYYRNAIAALHALKVDIEDILVFSDDIDTATELLKHSFNDQRITFVNDKTLGASDTLRLMSDASAIITANSSLSYWAAMLSTCQRSHIVYPDPWFRLHPTPDSLIPPSWTSVGSTFA